MKILSVEANNRKKTIVIKTKKSMWEMPFGRLPNKPTPTKRLVKIYVDKELGSEAVTYHLSDGTVDSIPFDAFLDYNRDPDYLRALAVHQLTIQALALIPKTDVSKQEICRRLGTSQSQLQRLLDPAYSKKSVDSMLKLLSTLGYEVTWKVSKAA